MEEEMLEQTNETENVETQTTEENVEGIELTDTSYEEKVEETETETEEEKEEVKTVTLEEAQKMIDDAVESRLRRAKKKFEKEKEQEFSKYKEAEMILNAGLETSSIDEANQKLRGYYKERGIDVPEFIKPQYNDKEIEILAKAEANEIVELGIEEMTREANELAKKGYVNLDKKEKVIFNELASRLDYENKKTELAKKGVKPEILEDKDFKAFCKKFNTRETSILEVYDFYTKTTKPKEEKKPIGSMTSNAPDKTKDYYSPDEVDNLTDKDLDNPKVMEVVRKSMLKW